MHLKRFIFAYFALFCHKYTKSITYLVDKTTIYLANKIYESNFQETLFAKKKDQFSKDYSDTIFKKIFKANRSEIAEKSELKPLEKLLQKVVFDCKTPNSAKIETDSETENFKLIAFLPFLKEG